MPASPHDGGPLLALDGTLPEHESLLSLCSVHSPIVAADGAALLLRKHGIAPDIIIGDLDSIGTAVDDPFFADSRVVCLPDQDEFDGGKALAWIRNEGFDRVKVLGVSGGMTDHVLNNISMLARFADRLSIVVVEQDYVGYIVTSELELRTQPDDRVSILPLPSAQVETEGLKWELRGEHLSIGGTTSASNRARKNTLRIQVNSGTVMLFHYAS